MNLRRSLGIVETSLNTCSRIALVEVNMRYPNTFGPIFLCCINASDRDVSDLPLRYRSIDEYGAACPIFKTKERERVRWQGQVAEQKLRENSAQGARDL